MNPRLNCRGAAVCGSDDHVEYSVEKVYAKLVGPDGDRRADRRLHRRLRGGPGPGHLCARNGHWRSFAVLLGPASITPGSPRAASGRPARAHTRNAGGKGRAACPSTRLRRRGVRDAPCFGITATSTGSACRAAAARPAQTHASLLGTYAVFPDNIPAGRCRSACLPRSTP
jgi:hypothetical protein